MRNHFCKLKAMKKPLSPKIDDQELARLHDAFFKNKISRREEQRLFAYHREQIPGMGDDEISLMLITSYPDYEKPDENGEVKTI